jgi:HEPN domain-containing protein
MANEKKNGWLSGQVKRALRDYSTDPAMKGPLEVKVSGIAEPVRVDAIALDGQFFTEAVDELVKTNPKAAAWAYCSIRDLGMASSLLRDGYFEGTAYHSQQATEKMLKAEIEVKAGKHTVTDSKGKEKKEHDIQKLQDEIFKHTQGEMEGFEGVAEAMTKANQGSRYPNPFPKIYSREEAAKMFNDAWMACGGAIISIMTYLEDPKSFIRPGEKATATA